MHRTGKKLLSVLLALAMVLSLLPGAALLAAADDVTYVQITSTPTAETLANMITYDQDAALAIYNSAEFQEGAGPNGGIVLIYNVGEADGEYMIIHNAQGTPEVMSMALDTIGMLLQYGFNVYIVQPGGSEPPPTPSNPTVYYRYYTLNTDDWTITPTVDSTNEYSLITDSSTTWTTWEEGWYVVDGNVVITDGVYLTGTVRLILCDGASLTVNGGIMSQIPGCKLIVYPGVMDSGAKTAPTIEGTGALNALSTEDYMPGIGYTTEVEIHGGTVYAVGTEDAAGIGGAPYADGNLLIMYDGTLTAIGGTNGAGIGGSDHYSGGNVSIYGGTVTAIGGENAAGIGAGANGSSDGALNFSGEEILLESSDDNLNWSPYAEGSPRGRYMRAQVIEEQPAAIPSADEGFSDDFEGEFTWTIQNGGQTNAWYLGEAVNNGGSKALYVSNDGGVSNSYTINTSSFVFVEKTFSFEGGNYNFAYDWRGDGETTYDYIRMALIPVDFEVTAGSNYPEGFNSGNLPEGWIAIDGGAKLNLQSEWQHDIYEDVRVPAGVYRAAIIWRNDTSAGSQPAGAIDNFSIAPGSPYVPAPSLGVGCTDDFEGENTWTLANGDLENAWVVGEAVNNGGSKALYISRDGGESNTYNIESAAFVYAYKTFNFDAGYYNVSYDWHVYGESTYDFLRVALIPNDVTIKAGTIYPTGFGSGSLPSRWIALDGGSKLNLQSEWQQFSLESIEVPAGEYRVAFIWRNDSSSGGYPPAAVDNFSLTPVNYTPVEVPVPADEGYTDDFEGINTWTLHNGEQVNAWYVGEAVNNGGSKALYVSKDGGFTNAYDIDSPSFVIAEKLFSFEGGSYDFAYDWRCGGEVNWDFLRVALVPEDAALTPGTDAPVGFSYDGSLPSGWIALDNGSQLATGEDYAWDRMSIEGLEVPAGIYRVAFCWRNDDEIGSEIPAAIDNFSVSPVGSVYVPVTGITLSDEALTLEVGETAILTATVEPDNATDPTVIWASSDEAVATVDNGVVTAIAEGEAEIIAMADGVSAVCTVTVLPLPPVSADEGYSEDFEGENTWKQGNEDQTNRWIVGEAVSNGGSKSLYISNDDSSHRYSPDGASFTFAEKAFSFAGGEYDFSYDWICNGEEDYDYLRVALVPESAVLTPGVIPSDFDISLPEDWIALDQGSFLCGSIDWQTMNLTKTAVPEGVYRVGFFWTNDPSVGNQPPAAIDNFSVAPSTESVITDGFYLIGPNGWTVDDLREEDRFDLNPNAEGEYMLSTALNVDDPVKVVKVENGAVSAWYPDGVGNEYIVDGPHSGTVNVYFRETWNDAWAEIGGFFWIEAQLTEPYLDESLNFFTSISVDIELSTRYSIPVETVENYASWYLEVSKLNADGEPIETKIFGDGGESVEMVRSAVWQAAYNDISIKELGTSFAATLHVFAPNGQEIYSPTQLDNLRNVVLDVLVSDEMPDQYQIVAADLLNFAAAAQIYFNYDVEHLANENLSAEAEAAMAEFASSGEAPAAQVNSPEGPTIFSSVSILNRIVLSLAVRGAGSANAVQLQIRNHDTGEVDTIDAVKRGSIWMGSYRGFGAEDMRTAFDIVAIADGEEFGTPITWSVEGYAREARLNEDSTEEELNLINALLHFVDSCVAVYAS